ncbi:MAG: membrane protein required for colicin V production [Comamonadaceae bacterium]|nr:MAG: membrane protein required for colicin V production [Comamonadaceae bacterium]
MAALDWIFVGVLLTSMVLGLWRGLVFEVLSLLSWIAAFVLAQWLALDAAQHLPMSGSSEVLRYAAGFVLVFVAAVMLGGLVAVVVKKLVSSVGLSPFDRALGGMFGMVRGVLLLLVATLLIAMTPVKASPIWQESVGVGVAGVVLKVLKPMLPSELEKFVTV